MGLFVYSDAIKKAVDDYWRSELRKMISDPGTVILFDPKPTTKENPMSVQTEVTTVTNKTVRLPTGRAVCLKTEGNGVHVVYGLDVSSELGANVVVLDRNSAKALYKLLSELLIEGK